MSVWFVLAEVLALIGVPVIIAVCMFLIIRDVKEEKARREARLEEFRNVVRNRLRKSAQDVNEATEHMEAYWTRIGARRRHEELAARRHLATAQWQSNVELRAVIRNRRPLKEWVQ